MDKKYYAVRILPRRATFGQDMTAEERGIMIAHSNYWRGMMAEGKVLVFGPVLDPAAMYGLGVIIAANEDEVRAMMADDPAMQIHDFDFHQMLAVVKE